jgi:hypothetical protein
MRLASALAALQVLQWLGAWQVARGSDGDESLAGALLLPVALVLAYAAARRLGSPRFAVWAAGVWALGPLALYPLFDGRYQAIYLRFLVELLGLGGGWQVPVAIAVLAGAVALRWIPAPAAALPGVVALVALSGLSFEWSLLQTNSNAIREFFWSVRVLEWAPLAGALGAARRSPRVAVGLLAWVAAYVLARGTDPAHEFGAGAFLTGILPAVPAVLLLAAAIPLLAPPSPFPRASLRAALAAARARRSGRRGARSPSSSGAARRG